MFGCSMGKRGAVYVKKGSGNPIVLIHGDGALVQDFIVSGLMEALAMRCRVIAFDRPG